jgi:glycosyltransferase involved in cell wall biosynthesis
MTQRICVFQVITRLIRGGAQRICLDICKGLDPSKYSVTLVTGPSAGQEGDFLEEVRQADIRLVKIPQLVRNISPLKDSLAFIKLFYLFITERPTIVHAHTSKAGFLACVAARLARVPIIIYSSHGHIFSRSAHIPGVSGNSLRIKLLYGLRKIASRCATKIIALNEPDKNEQVNLQLAPPGKYEVIYNGIDPASFSPTPCTRDKAYQGKTPLLACAGRLVPEKGYNFLIEALETIKHNYPSVYLLIIGDGEMKNTLETQVTRLNLQNHIQFLGLRQDVACLLNQADMVIVPSLYESFGLVILEALALKKPVIASAVNGIPAIIEDGRTGLLVPPADPSALGQAIIKLADNPLRMQQLGESGYQKLHAVFTKQHMISHIEQLYQKLLIS